MKVFLRLAPKTDPDLISLYKADKNGFRDSLRSMLDAVARKKNYKMKPPRVLPSPGDKAVQIQLDISESEYPEVCTLINTLEKQGYKIGAFICAMIRSTLSRPIYEAYGLTAPTTGKRGRKKGSTAIKQLQPTKQELPIKEEVPATPKQQQAPIVETESETTHEPAFQSEATKPVETTYEADTQEPTTKPALQVSEVAPEPTAPPEPTDTSGLDDIAAFTTAFDSCIIP